MDSKILTAFIHNLPKAELHLHIEGTIEPELVFKLSGRNGNNLKYHSVEKLQEAYNFTNLQDFLNLYYEGTNVLNEEQDFYDLTWAYLEKINSQNVLHTEIFFDPQTHTNRGVKFSAVIDGIHKALVDGQRKFGISTGLILSFLRHLDESSAINILDQAIPYKDRIIAVGLDSSEVGHPPSKFERVFARAREAGFLTVAHAGEEGPAEYVREAIELLKVKRIDHGNRSMEDDGLVEKLVKNKMPLTVCPLSNLKLKVVSSLDRHPAKKMLKKGLLVTLNSDDPAYFGGYINENYLQTAEALDLSLKDLYQIAKNSFIASFLPENKKAEMIRKLDQYYAEFTKNVH